MAVPDAAARRRPVAARKAAEPGIRISDAATRAGVSARTLRYYEELGLLTPSLYTAGGERRYTPDDLAHLQRILELREVLGMNLDEIKEFLALETRLDELRATYRATKGGDDQEGAGRAEGHTGGGAGAQRVAGRADQRQAGPHGRLPGQARAATPSAAASSWPSWTDGQRSPTRPSHREPRVYDWRDGLRRAPGRADPGLGRHERGMSEKKMFGGLAFLIGGNMAIAASGRAASWCGSTPTSRTARGNDEGDVAVMRGRPMAGWLRVAAEDLQTKRQLAKWVDLGTGFARSLPAKR